MTDLCINCLVLCDLRSTSVNVGQTSRDKFSELNKHIPLTEQLSFFNESLSMINTREDHGVRDDTMFTVMCECVCVCLLLKREERPS